MRPSTVRAPQALPRPPRAERGSFRKAGPRSPEETLRRARPFLSSLRLAPCGCRGEFLRRPSFIGRHPGRGAVVADPRPWGEAEAELALPAARRAVPRGILGGRSSATRGLGWRGPASRWRRVEERSLKATCGGKRPGQGFGAPLPAFLSRQAPCPLPAPLWSLRYLWGGLSGEHRACCYGAPSSQEVEPFLWLLVFKKGSPDFALGTTSLVDTQGSVSPSPQTLGCDSS